MNNLLAKIKNNKKKIGLLTSGILVAGYLLTNKPSNKSSNKSSNKKSNKQENQLAIELKKEFESYDKNLMDLLIKNKEKLDDLQNNIATKNETIQDLKLTIQDLKKDTNKNITSLEKSTSSKPPRIITKNLYQNTHELNNTKNELNKTKKELKELKGRYEAISLQVDYQFRMQEEARIAKQNLKDMQIQTIGYNKERNSLLKENGTLSIETVFLKDNLEEAKKEIAFLRREWDIQFGKLTKENEMLKNKRV